ncbi:MAG: type IV toxin-antitoxin system AbiEi family antitoxin [Oligoflexales bacterium]|nr:type IV toxin-antitoxin system AbiEi family antitoxin [Oligoflexales bacterium]
MTKLNKILGEWQSGDVHTLKWFKKYAVEQRTAYKYSESGALKKIGTGIFSRPHDKLSWLGAVRAMQNELGLNLHVGGVSALEVLGSAHNLQIAKRPKIDLIVAQKTVIPKWVKKNDWGVDFLIRRSNLITPPLAFLPFSEHGISIAISSREQAILEMLDSLDLSAGFETAENYLSGLLNLRPEIMQGLLERCQSVKVKRVFLYLSESLELPVFKKLFHDRINLGKGKRVIVKGGCYNAKYKITVPRSIEEEINDF